ncbi:hypothetical protein FMM74_022345, partial [Lachnospiraceae bacterium MD308]|nr:hypothetical protein [Lachnospiraceae bacterium MD308]
HQDTRTARYNPKCFWEAQRGPGKIYGTGIRKYPERRHDRQSYQVTSKIASNQKNVLFDQGREAPHFLIGLSSGFEKKVGDF